MLNLKRPRARPGVAGRLIVGLVAAALAACAGSPRQRPVRMGPAGGGLETVRRQFEGKWELVSLERLDASGKATPVDAAGQLTYDAFGNLSVQGEVRDASMRSELGERPALLNVQGRAVIDTTRQELRILDLSSDRPVDEKMTATVSPDRVRTYQFEGDLLKLTIRDTAGTPTARTTWKRIP